MKRTDLIRQNYKKVMATVFVLTVSSMAGFAQATGTGDGKKGIDEATSKVTGYFGSGEKLMYAVGAILGLIGAVKVYTKWNAGEPDTSKVAASWFGSCIFLVVVATVIKAFFGVG